MLYAKMALNHLQWYRSRCQRTCLRSISHPKESLTSLSSCGICSEHLMSIEGHDVQSYSYMQYNPEVKIDQCRELTLNQLQHCAWFQHTPYPTTTVKLSYLEIESKGHFFSIITPFVKEVFVKIMISPKMPPIFLWIRSEVPNPWAMQAVGKPACGHRSICTPSRRLCSAQDSCMRLPLSQNHLLFSPSSWSAQPERLETAGLDAFLKFRHF